jgi:hypothetical protein
MQTLTVEVADSFMQDFLHFIESQKEKVFIKSNEKDTAFIEEQRELHQALEEYRNSSAKTFSLVDGEYWDDTRKRLLQRQS